MKSTGLPRYFYEYVFHQVIEAEKERTGAPFMVSRARFLRQQLDYALGQRGTSIDVVGGGTFINALTEVMSSNVENYVSPFTEDSSRDVTYLEYYASFTDMLGRPHMEDGVSIPPRVTELGERLPISPYDPRFANRMTIKRNGSKLSYVRSDDVELYTNDDPSLVEDARYPEFKFYTDVDGEWLRPSGDVFSIDDASGLTELSSRMTRSELAAVRPWVESAVRRPDGSMDVSQFMSNDAIYRAAMIMDELRNEGVAYKVMPDRRAGQVKLRIEGTSIDVRIMDSRSDESYIGRVYDNGVSSYFMTTESSPTGQRSRIGYVPTAQDCINLVRVAQGKAVARLDGQGLVGETGTYTRTNGANVNTTYRSGNKLSSTYADLQNAPVGAKVLLQHDTEHRTTTPSFLGNPELAENALKEAVASARSRFMAELNPAGIIMQAMEYNAAEDKGEVQPDFSMDPVISAIQQEYWDLVTGRTDRLLRPGADREALEAELGDDLRLDTLPERMEYQRRLDALAYPGDMSAQLAAHTQDIVDTIVGTYEPHEVRDAKGVSVERRFDPIAVARYMASSSGISNNTRMLASAMRRLEISADELMGSDYAIDSMKDRLISFDDASSVDMLQSDSPFVVSMGEHIRQSLLINGVSDVSSLKIDDKGVVRYIAQRPVSEALGKSKEITGYLGQIWVPNELGAITTQFGGTENFMYAPGWEATIVPQKPGETKSMEDRTIFRGYEQLMRDQISYRVRSDMLEHSSRTEIGTPDSLNRVHRTLYSERHPVDFLEKCEENELPREWAEAILKTEARRVRYSNEIGEGSTINADYHARHNPNIDLSDDSSMDAYVLTGGRNMSVLDEAGDHLFDPLMTGQARNQGIVRFLNESVTINPDGTPNPGEVGDRTPLMKIEGLSKLSFNPFDRQQMTASNVMKASSIISGTKTAFTTIRGWNFDDPILVSKSFAESHTIVGENGTRRSLIAGDKLSDLNGNKGVISRVIDPAMSDEEAERLDLVREVQFFRENPSMELVMSPFSAISRLNGGSAREMMENPSDLVVNGEVRSGGIGEATFIITHKAADKVTNVYDENEEGSERGGRRVGSQMVAVMMDAGCDQLVTEMMADNDSSLVSLREYLNVTGLDIDPTASLREGREDHGSNDGRRVFPVPDTSMFRSSDGTKSVFVEKKVLSQFSEMTAASGGVMELPWSLNFQTGAGLPNHTDSTYELPLLSVNLRTGQEFRDGRSVVHDYTMRYARIYLEAAKYTYAKERLESGEELKPAARAEFEDQVYGKADVDGQRSGRGTCQIAAQTQFNQLSRDIINNQLEGKHNLLADKVIGRKAPYSATSIMTSDPRLGLNQVGMNEAMMKALHIKEGDRVLIERAPELHNGAVRYMEVKLDNDVTGVCINPAADLSFEGDFDGDTFGVYSTHHLSKAAQREAMVYLSPESNMLNFSVPAEETLVKGEPALDYPLYFQNNLDYQVAMHQNPEFKDEFLSIQREVNRVERAFRAGELDVRDVAEVRSELMGELNTLYKDMADSQYASVSLSFENPQKHVESVIEACVDTGAKGSMSKAMQYARYLGLEVVDAPFDETLGRERPVFEDTGHTLHTRAEDKEVQYATAVKALGAGVSGMFSKRAIKELRNVDLQAVNNVMSKTNQATLQSKHNAAEAFTRFGVTMGPARSLMKGLEIAERQNSDGSVEWVERRDEKNRPIRATRDVWVDQCMALHNSKDGLNVTVNPEMVERLADALTNPDGTIRGVEPEDGSTASTMDRLAYGGTFQDWVEAARSRENLFDGEQNRKLAPKKVRYNIELSEAYELAVSAGVSVDEPQLKPLAARDCIARPGETRSAATFGDSGVEIIKPEISPEVVPMIETLTVTTPTLSPVADIQMEIDRLNEKVMSTVPSTFDGPVPF